MIFVLTDDLDYASVFKMPEIGSSLLEEGTSFDNAFTSQSLCCPSRATGLTGLYAHNHNVIEAAGKLENTFIIFTSDNGWFQGEHRIPEEKDRPYEESARGPLFVRGPGVPAGSKVEKLVLNTDLAPTFAELAGVSFPADRRSLTPLLLGEDPPSWRSAVLLEGFVGKTFRAYGAIRTESRKYVEYKDGGKELYDLEADPYELENAYDSADSSLVENLKTRLDALRSCAGDGCQEAEDAP